MHLMTQKVEEEEDFDEMDEFESKVDITQKEKDDKREETVINDDITKSESDFS